MAEVMDRWEESEKYGKVKPFCTQNYLNRNTLRQLREQKSLFSQYLMDMGFLNSTNYRQKNLNMNSDNIALIKAVICSGLYPNVAVIQ
jgi:ATP-dependent RNA helicase DHX36